MKIGVIITTFNRPEYLRQCLASVRSADLSQVQTVLIVDDKSTDLEAIKLINDFQLEGVQLIKVFSKENRSIKGSLLFGLDLLFQSCDVVTNLDGDAIVTPDAFNRLLKLRDQFPGYIITGFNCSTKNRNGSIRHKILEQGEGWNKKYSVGGINMMFDALEYFNIVKPALQKSLKENLNWDYQSCILSNTLFNKPIVVLEPSCVQHIGVQSSMGHSSGGEPPDVADDFRELSDKIVYHKATAESYDGLRSTTVPIIDEVAMWKVEGKINLPNVTLAAVDCVDLKRVFKASDKCTEGIIFGDVKIFTSLNTEDSRCENIIPIKPIASKEDYSWFVMKELSRHIKTSHILIFQHDGYVLNPSAWDDEWLQYDYIGAPWRFGDSRYPVGNGGFSLRSKKLMDIVANHPEIYPMNEPGVSFQKEEDHVICRMFGKMLTEKYDIKFAPIEVAEKFSIEAYSVKPPANKYTGQFGFHGTHVVFS